MCQLVVVKLKTFEGSSDNTYRGGGEERGVNTNTETGIKNRYLAGMFEDWKETRQSTDSMFEASSDTTCRMHPDPLNPDPLSGDPLNPCDLLIYSDCLVSSMHPNTLHCDPINGDPLRPSDLIVQSD